MGNTKIINKFRYHLEDTECIYCRHYGGKKRGCKLKKCCCDDIKVEAKKQNRIKRRRGVMDWAG